MIEVPWPEPAEEATVEVRIDEVWVETSQWRGSCNVVAWDGTPEDNRAAETILNHLRSVGTLTPSSDNRMEWEGYRWPEGWESDHPGIEFYGSDSYVRFEPKEGVVAVENRQSYVRASISYDTPGEGIEKAKSIVAAFNNLAEVAQ